MRVFYVVVLVLVAGVFYVVLLVLVAGAVPSHGRTESEGTVFNKTQLHESMSNVTVSSSKLEAYSFSYLAMQWPGSFCNSLNTINRQCKQPVPARFTVHGLWPQYNPTHGVDCKGIYGRYQLFNIRLLDPNLLPSLNQYWPDLKRSDHNNRGFWGAEYNKHGSCTFINQDEYFYRTLTMVAYLGDLALKLSLFRPGPGIIPGGNYNAIAIRDAVYRFTSKMPTLHCNKGDHRSFQLLEIRFCADRNGILIDCVFYSNCGNGRVSIPRP